MNDSQNIQKMKLLTFLHLVEGKSSVDFKTVQHEADIEAEEVEQFVIDGELVT